MALVGQVMKVTNRRSNPVLIKSLILDRIEEISGHRPIDAPTKK